MPGISLKSIELKNVVVYQELELKNLDKQGFVTVSGINNDSPNVRDNKNGVGKSLMFGTLPNLLYEADPLALTKRSKTNMLKKGSSITLEWQSPLGGLVRVEQTASKYKVYLNGEDQKVDRQDVAKTWIKKHFPLSPDEFYSYCYIQTQVPHPFQRAKPAERLKYLTELFGLDVYDRIRAAVKLKLDAAKDAEKESKGVADIYDVTARKQEALKVTDDTRKKAKKFVKKSDELKEKRNELYERFAELTSERKDARRYYDILSEIEKLGVVSDNPKKELKNLEGILRKIEKFEDYQAELKKYRKRHAALREELKELPKSEADPKALSKKHSKLVDEEEEIEELLNTIEEELEAYQEWKDDVKRLTKSLSKLKKPKKKSEELDEELAEAQSIIRAYEKLSHKVDGKTCPTCGQDVDLRAMKRAADKAETLIKDIRSQQEYYEIKSELRDLEKNKVSKPEHDKDELKKRLKKVSAKIDAIAEEFETIKKRDAILVKLESLEKPEQVHEPKRPCKNIEKRIARLEEFRDLNQSLKAFKKPSKSAKEIEKEYNSVDAQIKELTSQIGELERSAQKVISKVQEYDHYEDTLVDLRTKLSKLQPLIDKRVLYETLYKAYSGTALKLEAMEGRLQLISDKLNENSHLVYPEPMQWRLFTCPQGIGAEVTRLSNGTTTDFSIMSGAETNCFRLLWAISILPFVPENRRPDFIVLDEPESNCSPAVRDHLIENFLPILKRVVPNIYWLTPQPVEEFSDKQWTVEKTKGISVLTKKEI
ncbi:putative exonuclease [Dickeya phage vB_DsoM_JA13]|uniref:Putative exonuclease n=1 Tax=Dickeya phage vB_DsoM_JA13 TaxID=2283030 RepID=A0A384ZWI2_9CAUD|nr:putative exonuclease [Dickeya phage vB_DsoM_JA13]